MADEFGHRIAVGVDGSAANRPALLWSIQEARARGEGVVAVYAWHVPAFAYYSPGYVPIAADDLAQHGGKLLEEALASLGATEGVRVEIRSVEGPPHKALERVAAEAGVDLVVVGQRGHGAVASLILGSTSHALSHHCPKPLVIVPGSRGKEESSRPVRHIVVGVDGSEGADTALRWAASEAKAHNALLEVAVAWSWVTISPELIVDMPVDLSVEVAAKEILNQAIERLDMQAVDTKLTVQEGAAADVLLGLAGSADLLVVGTRGLGRAHEMFLGSTSHQCAHRSPVPVAIIPTDHTDHKE
jgi:nucleotide-binding universal stress UspA family protein